MAPRMKRAMSMKGMNGQKGTKTMTKGMKGKKGMKSMDKFVDYWRPTICPRCGCLHEVYWS